MNARVHRCKCHQEPYTVCPVCGAEYCSKHWLVCPRTSWAPAHALTETDRGRRDRELAEARAISAARRNRARS